MKRMMLAVKRIAHVISMLSLLTVCLSILAHAEGTSCAFPTVIVPDGRMVLSTIPAGATFWFVYDLAAGHSYSVEVKSVTAQWGTFPGTATYLAPGGCSGTLVTTDTTNFDPKGNSTARRVSFIATAARYWLTLASTSGSAIDYSIMVTDTTLFSPRWTTYGGYTTQYGFVNTTNSPISGTLTLYDQVSGGPYTMSITVAVGSRSVVTIPTQLVVPANHAGQATFAFVGPPGAIMADGLVQNSSGTVILPITFAARNFQH